MMKNRLHNLWNKTVDIFTSDPDFIKTLRFVSDLSTEDKEAFNIPSDYKFKDNGEITYLDLYALIKYEIGDGNSLEDEWDYLESFTDNIEPL